MAIRNSAPNSDSPQGPRIRRVLWACTLVAVAFASFTAGYMAALWPGAASTPPGPLAGDPVRARPGGDEHIRQERSPTEVPAFEIVYPGSAVTDKAPYRVVLSTTKERRLRLEVLGADGKSLWTTTPSSTMITASLPHERIVILEKVRNAGVMDFDKPGPTRGGKIFDLRGNEIGALAGDVFDGFLVDRFFLARREGAAGIVGYDVVTAKELWRRDDVRRDDMRFFAIAAGDGATASLRGGSADGKTVENTIIDARSGRTLLTLSGTITENPGLLCCRDGFVATVRTERAGDGWRCRSKIVDGDRKEVGEVLWPGTGMPCAAAMSAGDRIIAAVCVMPAGDAEDSGGKKRSTPPRLEAVVCDFSGRILARRELLCLKPGQPYTDFEPSLELKSRSLVVRLTPPRPPIEWRQQDQVDGVPPAKP